MNIYLVESKKQTGYGFEGCIIIAESEEEAKKFFVFGEDETIKLIGTANKDVEKGILLESWTE